MSNLKVNNITALGGGAPSITDTPTDDMVVMKSGDTMTGNLDVQAYFTVLPASANGDGTGISNGTSATNGMYIDSPINPERTGAIGMTVSGQNIANLSLAKKAPSTTGASFIRFQYVGNVSGSITLQTSTSINYNATSDYRLKENVVPIAGAASLVNQLKPYRYNFISNPELPMLGFLAHEVQEVLPSVVTGTKDAVDEDGKDDYQQMDYGKLTPILTAALQEALARIETLEAKVQSVIDAQPKL